MHTSPWCESGKPPSSLAAMPGSDAAPQIQDAIKAWLVPHLECFYGHRKAWTTIQVDKYHELLGLIYCYESEKHQNSDYTAND